MPEFLVSKSSSMFGLKIGSRSTKLLSQVDLMAARMLSFWSHSISFGDRTV